MTVTEQQVLGQLESLRGAWRDLLTRVADGLPLDSVLDEVKSDPGIAECRLLKCLDAMPDARKVDNRRFMAGNGIDERIKLGDMTESQISAVLGTYNV